MKKKIIVIVFLFLFLFNSLTSVLAADYGDYVAPTNAEIASIKSGNYGFLTEREKNNYTAIFKDKNLILLEVDGLITSLINRNYKDTPITPFLNSLAQSSVYFNNYFLSSKENLNDTSLATLYSIYPNKKYPGFTQIDGKNTKGLQHYFSENGYQTIAIKELPSKDAGYVSYKSIGFTKYNELKDSANSQVFDNILAELAGEGKKFIYAETTSKENPFFDNFKGNYNEKEKILVERIKTLDKNLQEFVTTFKNSSYSKNTELIIVGKNSAPTSKFMDDAVKKILSQDSLLASVNCPLFIVNGLETSKFLSTIGTVDIAPTIANLYGFENEIYPMFGKDIFSAKKKAMDTATVMLDLNRRFVIYKSVAMDIKNEIDGPKIDAYNRLDMKYVDNSGYDLVAKKSFIDTDLSFGLVQLDKLFELSKNKSLIRIDPKKTIMHAGGEINGMTYTNLLEALDKHYKSGKRYFEVDISLTTDNYPVNIHSWDGFSSRFFGIIDNGKINVPTKAQYDKYKSVHGYTKMDLFTMITWLKAHKDAYIITDVKDKNVAVLSQLISMAGNDKNRIIPQIYNFEEYEKVKSLGYGNIILTLYASNYSKSEVLEFASTHRLYGVTMSSENYYRGYAAPLLKKNINVFVHTINNKSIADMLFKSGIKAIYTDTL
ncbi:MAG: hypothetical protein MSH08_07755 [Ezakiella sp.]|nr:hypothetical protein [Ezakiella sp.]MDD7471205.1 hypothetical protein [Bacillota bacterium]MDY3923342.1 hypothetical protein [Ezakiella sp.]